MAKNKSIYVQEFEDLKTFLINNYNGKIKSGGSQVVIRCPWCGDSRDPKNAHLYIGINKRRNLSISYYCFLCGRGATINNEFFRMIQCYDVNLTSAVLRYNLSRSKSLEDDHSLDYYRRMSIINNNGYGDLTGTYNKIQYINNRLGVNLGFDDLTRLKIVLNLTRYIRENHIMSITRRKEVLEELTKKHIGFLSVDNTYMIMRATVDPKTLIPEIQMRYTNYRLLSNRFYAYTFYAIPGEVDTSKEVHFHMAEGCFDILGVYFHGDKSNRTGNEIFAASTGRTFYLDLLGYFVGVCHIPGIICTVDMYIDKEKDGSIKFDNKLKQMIAEIRYFTKSVKVHVNDYPGEKDFGVPADRIIDKVIYSLD